MTPRMVHGLEEDIQAQQHQVKQSTKKEKEIRSKQNPDPKFTTQILHSVSITVLVLPIREPPGLYCPEDAFSRLGMLG